MSRHRKTRKELKKQKKVIIASALSLLLIITVGYAAFQTNLSITAKGNVKEKSRVIQAWSNTDQTDFHSDFYKENIVSATFLDNADVPSNATESWNVSEDKTHGGVMAWVIPSIEDSTKYDLYIGAKDGVIANVDSSYLFNEFMSLTSINFGNSFDTSNTTDMTAMFRLCTSIKIIDISNFDTRNVTSMRNMFAMLDNTTSTNIDYDNKLSQIIFGDNFSVENVINMAQMFVDCYELTSIDVSDWDTSKVQNMVSVFANCRSLEQLDLSNWDTSSAVTMNFMFLGCNSLKNLDISNFNTSKVSTMQQMFHECTSLSELNLCSFDTRNVTVMYEMFRDTSNLTKVKVGTNWSTSQADIRNMFWGSNINSVTTGQC